MFANQRCRSSGLAPIVAVALVLIGWVGGAGLLLKVYRDGGGNMPSSQCEVVCRGAEKSGANT